MLLIIHDTLKLSLVSFLPLVVFSIRLRLLLVVMPNSSQVRVSSILQWADARRVGHARGVRADSHVRLGVLWVDNKVSIFAPSLLNFIWGLVALFSGAQLAYARVVHKLLLLRHTCPFLPKLGTHKKFLVLGCRNRCCEPISLYNWLYLWLNIDVVSPIPELVLSVLSHLVELPPNLLEVPLSIELASNASTYEHPICHRVIERKWCSVWYGAVPFCNGCWKLSKSLNLDLLLLVLWRRPLLLGWDWRL